MRFFFQAEDGIRDGHVTGVQTCALPISILTKLLTIKGKEVVSAINPLAIINGKIIFSLKFKLRTIASTIGVSMRAAPSFANKAATTAPRRLTYTNMRIPLPLANLAI